MFEKLRSIGLTKTESKIYFCLVELGKAQAGTISRKSGIHRRSVYDALERLIEKGLASYIKENDKRFYISENPEKISEIAAIQKENIDSVLPQLKAMFGESKNKQETSFYRGTEGIKTIFEDQIIEKKPIYVIGAAYNAESILKYFLPHYNSNRIKKKIKLHLIYCGDKFNQVIPLSEVKYLPQSYGSPVSTNIYADKVAIIIWGDEPVAILIKNKSVASTYKNYFDLLWKIAKKK